MATIIISMVLLVMVAQEGFAGWHARFNVLGTESKEQATALADGCIDQALMSVITGFSYTTGATTTLPSGACYISPVDTSAKGFVTIRSQAQVNGTYANVAIALSVNDVHLGSIPSSPGTGTLIIQTLVNNAGNVTKTGADFTMHVAGVSPTKTDFAGSETGVIVRVSPGTFSVSEDAIPGYRGTPTADCAGTISGGDIKSCTITNTAVTTTLTLVDTVVNDNRGQKAPTDFTLLIDGVPATFGSATTVLPGAHELTIATSSMSGYLSSVDWVCTPPTIGVRNGTTGMVDVTLGDNKICMVKLDDIPPPNPSCADTVVMLDRTGSMNSTELGDEKNAANALVNLYGLVTTNSPGLPAPLISVGSFGGITAATVNNALIPNNAVDSSGFTGLLTSVYSTLTAAITKITSSTSCSSGNRSGTDTCTDLSAAFSSASSELNSARHKSANQKVLILISDGAPSLPIGTGAATTSPFFSPAANTSTGSIWSNAIGAYAPNDNSNANVAIGSGSTKHQFYNFNFANIPSDATISGIEVDADAWSTSGSGAITATIAPSATGGYDQWATNTTNGSDVTAVTTNDSDSTYISPAASVHTFGFPNLSLPSGSTINSVTIAASAKASSSGAPLYLVLEKGSGTSNIDIGSSNTLTNTSSYATTSRVLTTNPLNSNRSWTTTDVNAMNFGVRTTNGVAIPRVSQLLVNVAYTTSGTVSGSTAALAPSGVGTGSWTSAASAFLSDNVYATDATNNHQQVYTNFNLSVPSGATITGIQVTAEAKVSGTPTTVTSGTLYPTSNGAYSAWTTGDYTTVNETGTPSCSSSDYVLSGTTNARSSFGIDLTAIPNGATITGVTVSVGDRGDSSSGGTYKTFVRLNGSDTDGTSTFTATGSSGTTCTSHTQAFTIGSVTKSAGTALEIGVLKVSGSSNAVRVGVINATVTYTTLTGSMSIALSSNNGSTWTNSETIPLSSTEAVLAPASNSSTDTWSKTWSSGDFQNGNFALRVTNTTSSGTTLSLDQVKVVVNYTTSNNSSAVATLVPSTTGTYDQWTPRSGTDVSSVAINDGDTNYIDASTPTHTFTIATSSIPVGATINSITLSAAAKATSAGAPLALVVEKGVGATYVGATNTLTNTTSYASTTLVLATNPLTNKPWTIADLGMHAFGVRTSNGSASTRVTQMLVSVNYTPQSTCQLGTDLSWDGGTTWTSEKTASLTGASATYVFGTTSSAWGGHTWLPSELSNTNFRARIHAIDPGSGCQSTDVDHVDWLRLAVTYTQSFARQAALQAADAAKLAGLNIFSIYYSTSPVTADQNFFAELSNGSNPYPPYQNGSYNDPGSVYSGTLTSSPSSAVNPSQWTSPVSAFTSDNKYTTNKVATAMQSFGNFALTIPPASTIKGIEVDLTNVKGPSSSGCRVGVEISSDGGATYTSTATQSSTLSSSSFKSYTLGGSTSLWGRTWISTDFNPGKFAVRLQDVRGTGCSTSGTLSLDQVKVVVSYSVNQENADGDNFFIAPTSADMQGIFDFIGNSVCPAARPVVTVPATTGSVMVITRVTNNDSGTKTLTDFAPTMNAQNQGAQVVAPTDAPGVVVVINPGTYNVSEPAVAGYTETLSDGCIADATNPIAAGETRVCIITNDDIPPPPPPPNLNILQSSWQELPIGQ